ncbi:MAG: cupin domain-containing protein [Chthoniobacterales bacterium]
MKIFALLFVLAVAAANAEPTEGYLPAIKATPVLRTTTTAGGQPIAYPKVDQPEVTALLVEIPPGAETGWHKHPFPAYAYLLSGELTVELEGGKTNTFKAGDAIAETVNMLHNGKNNGKEPVKLIMFVTGTKDEPFTIKAAK